MALLAGILTAGAQVLPLDFADGNGTTSVDQFAGIAGSGWKTAWTAQAGGNVTGFTNTVTNANPLAGGGNYLQTNFSVVGTNQGGQWLRLSRQLDSSAISLSSPVMYAFTLRPDSTVSNSNETFTIFSGTTATNNTGAGDTWKITADGGGWNVYNGPGNTLVGLGKVGASTLSGTTYQFNIYSDPLTKTWSLTINNLTNNVSVSSGVLGWRSTASVENSFLNFISQSGSESAATFGYSLDSLTVIPEPSAVALMALGGAAMVVHFRRRLR